MVVLAVFDRKNRCRGPLRVGSTCNVGEKLAKYARVADMSATYLAKDMMGDIKLDDNNTYKDHHEGTQLIGVTLQPLPFLHLASSTFGSMKIRLIVS